MASMRALGLMRSLRTGYCRLPIASSHNINIAAYRNNIRLTSSVAIVGNSSGSGSGSSSNISSEITTKVAASATAAATTDPIKETLPDKPETAILNFKWDVSDEIVSKIVEPKLTEPIIPFAQLTFIQKLFLPYTYAVMYYLDFLTNYFPWWGSIVITTLTCKIIFFPLLVKQQIIGHKTHNLLPETQKLQAEINECLVSGDAYNTAFNRAKLKMLYDANGLSMMSRLWPALIQAPMFMSLFFLLRRLSSEPLESLTTGGFLWITNLSVPDPYYILPIITCTSLFALLELGLGAEGASGGPSSTMRPMGRWLMRGMPVVLFAIVYSFPAALNLFWATNNVFSLVSSIIMKRPSIMKRLNIPERIKHPPEALPLTNQSLKGQLNSAKEMSRRSKTTHEIRRLDDIAFKKAGVGPLKKTYKHPPVKEG